MKNGRPETYREILALKQAHLIEKYVTVTDPGLIPEIFRFIMESPANKVTLTHDFLMFVSYNGETVKAAPIIPRVPVQYLAIQRDKTAIRTPSSSGGGDFGGSSSNNNNNNNNNNNG